MISGEHAVLKGFPGICRPIKKILTARIREAYEHRDKITIYYRNISKTLILSFKDVFDPVYNQSFSIAVLRKFSDFFKSGFCIDIFSDINPSYGFGSSAALSVALSMALQEYFQSKFNICDLCLDVSRSIQGAASGGDILTSYYKKIVYYENNRVELLNSRLVLEIFYSGSKMKTADVIKYVQEKENNEPEKYKEIYQRIGNISQQMRQAMLDLNYEKIGQLFNDHHQCHKDLGVSNDTLNTLAQQLRQRCHGSKISGSGLGDCVIGLMKKTSGHDLVV